MDFLGITEPGGGSDVANLATTAVRDGDHFVVSGSKTYITGGMRANSTAVRTGGEGAGGVSMLLIPTDAEGFSRTPLDRKMLGASIPPPSTLTKCASWSRTLLVQKMRASRSS